MECKVGIYIDVPRGCCGINRNIVECKVSLARSRSFSISVLIETLWNVKRVPTVPYLAKGAVLIETLWNVK